MVVRIANFSLSKFYMQVHKFWISLAEVCRAIPNKDGFDRYSADYHFIGAIQGTDDLDWIQVGEASFGLAN
ncbi:putative protein OS=Lysinibacillus sphaericus OX=1421 GN=LYSIN_01409 PE=4 SV=1 [Lysinibacillus sphaericus]